MPTETALSTSSSLLQRVQERDESAWRQLVSLYGPTIYQWGRRAGVQPTDAADLVQQVFETVMHSVARFERGERSSFRGWLWTIFRSRLMDLYRQSRHRPQAMSATTFESLAKSLQEVEPPELTSNELAQTVRKAVEIVRADFSETTWQAFWCSTILRQRTVDIATQLHLTPSAVCMCRSRVLRRLRETLDGLGLPNIAEH